MPYKDPRKHAESARKSIQKKRNEESLKERIAFLTQFAIKYLPRMMLDIQEKIDKGDQDPRRVREISALRFLFESAQKGENRFWRLGFCPNCNEDVYFGEHNDPMNVVLRLPGDPKMPNQVFPI